MIFISDLMKDMENKKIIDIRNPLNYNNNHIKGAKNIPYDKLISEPNKYLNYNETYYLYCQKGITSLKACNLLGRYGYKVINIVGGYEAYITQN
jgi:rhodanese-related sulfurtransferase